MTKMLKLAVVAAGFVFLPWVAGAQSSATTGTSPQAVQGIPADQQATREQVNKLFDVMRVRAQYATMTKLMP